MLIAFRRTRRIGVACLISMVFGLVITNVVIKNWAARIRPYDFFNDLELIIEKQHDFSFPSGHSTNSFACAWVIFRMAKKRYGVPTLLLAVLIALSRLFEVPLDRLLGVETPAPAEDGALSEGALAAVENISYLSVIICFVMFLVNDLYGFVSWKRMEKRQMAAP